MPVRGAPDAGDCGYARVFFIQHHLQTQPVIPGCREQMIVHFEARLFFGTAIETTQIGQKIEVEARRSFQEDCKLRLCAHGARRWSSRPAHLRSRSPIPDDRVATPPQSATACDCCWVLKFARGGVLAAAVQTFTFDLCASSKTTDASRVSKRLCTVGAEFFRADPKLIRR